MKKISVFPSLLISMICALGSMTCVVGAQTTLLSDNFSGDSVDTNKWTVFAFSGGSATVQSNNLIINHPQYGQGVFLTSKAEFTPPYKISGAFQSSGIAVVNIRSDGSFHPSYIDPLGIAFSWRLGQRFESVSLNGSDPPPFYAPLFGTDISYNTSLFHSFDIYDFGDRIRVDFNGATIADFPVDPKLGTGKRIILTDGDNWSGGFTQPSRFQLITVTALTDMDNDNILDAWETNTGIYVSETDTGTDPNNPDTDGDGLKDGAEYLLTDLGFDPLVPNGEQMNSLFAPSFYPSIEVFAPPSTTLKMSLGGVTDVATNNIPNGWVYNTTTKQMSGVLSGITSSSGQLTGIKAPGLNLPVTFNFHPQNKQTIGRFTRISTKKSSSPPFPVVPPTANSGLPVTLSVKSGPATISSNNVVAITGVGTVVIAANQPGNNNFLPAPEVRTSFRVTRQLPKAPSPNPQSKRQTHSAESF